MNTAIEQLRKLVMEGKKSIPNRGVNTFTLLQELTFIENRKQVDYFLAMHRYVKELKSLPDVLIGPGRRWMTASHVCHALGITNICLGSINLEPIDFWGNEDSDTTMDIEVDEDTYECAYFKAAEVFGYDNVACTSDIDDIQSEEENYTFRGYRNKQKGYSIVVCPDGVAEHYKVYEVEGDDEFDMLCIDGDVEPTANIHIFRFNVISSDTLTRIKRIQSIIVKNGKECPGMYHRGNANILYYSNGYQTLFDEEDRSIPFFGDKLAKEMTKTLFDKITSMEDLLTIAVLYSTGLIYEIHVHNIEDYKKKHGVIRLFDKWRFPYGFLYKEDVCGSMTGWIGMTWKESARIVQLMSGINPLEAECLKHIYLHRGMDNGFKEEELNHIWSSLFDRTTKKPLPSMANYIGPLYQYAFLAMLKKDFPEEYQSIDYGRTEMHDRARTFGSRF